MALLPALMVPKAEAQQKIEEQIGKGKKIRSSFSEKSARELKKWSKYNFELLVRLFSTRSVATEFDASCPEDLSYDLYSPEEEEFDDQMDAGITFLESVLERLDLIPDRPQKTKLKAIPRRSKEKRRAKGNTAYHSVSTKTHGSDIFVVHGREEAAKESVGRLVEKLGLRPTILHEQPNAGRTIIEKFEKYSNVSFTIVLLTPDDVGSPRDKKDESKPRARQNVILEMGYFMGKLGRGRVCALYKEGVEIPSDYQGVLYIPMDSAGAWRMALAKEIKNAGIDIDLNKL